MKEQRNYCPSGTKNWLFSNFCRLNIPESYIGKGEARTNRKRSAAWLFRVFVNVFVEGVELDRCVVRLVSFKMVSGRLKLVRRTQHVPGCFFTLNFRSYRRRPLFLFGYVAHTLKGCLIGFDIIAKNLLSVSVEEGTQRLLKVRVQRNDLLQGLKNYKLSKENWERNLLERECTLKAITASVKHLRKKWSSSEYEHRSAEKTVEELMTTYSEQQTVEAGSLEKLVRYGDTRFVRTTICTSKDILKWCLNEKFELGYSSPSRRRKRLGIFKRTALEPEMDTALLLKQLQHNVAEIQNGSP